MKGIRKEGVYDNIVPTAGEWTRLRTASTALHLTNHFSRDKTNKNEMGGACGTFGAEEGYIRELDGQT